MIEKLISKCRFYTGKDVLIEWDDPDADWPSYHVIAIDEKSHGIHLRGINTPEGDKHDGSEFWAAIADIVTIKPFPTTDNQ
jgi:hypothetical protein